MESFFGIICCLFLVGFTELFPELGWINTAVRWILIAAIVSFAINLIRDIIDFFS